MIDPSWDDLLDGEGVLDDSMVARSRFDGRNEELSQLVAERRRLMERNEQLRTQLARTQLARTQMGT